MAEPAGNINDRGRSNRWDFDEIIAASFEEVREVATQVCDLVYDVFPRPSKWCGRARVQWAGGRPDETAS